MTRLSLWFFARPWLAAILVAVPTLLFALQILPARDGSLRRGTHGGARSGAQVLRGGEAPVRERQPHGGARQGRRRVRAGRSRDGRAAHPWTRAPRRGHPRGKPHHRAQPEGRGGHAQHRVARWHPGAERPGGDRSPPPRRPRQPGARRPRRRRRRPGHGNQRLRRSAAPGYRVQPAVHRAGRGSDPPGGGAGRHHLPDRRHHRPGRQRPIHRRRPGAGRSARGGRGWPARCSSPSGRRREW